jgi:hypothetical protein
MSTHNESHQKLYYRIRGLPNAPFYDPWEESSPVCVADVRVDGWEWEKRDDTSAVRVDILEGTTRGEAIRILKDIINFDLAGDEDEELNPFTKKAIYSRLDLSSPGGEWAY